MAELVPVGPGIKDPALGPVLKSHEDALLGLRNPGAPEQCAEIDTAANLATKLPPDAWPNCRIIVTDKNCLAISTNVAGTWTWLRADGSAL